ncbi:MAG: hypothetical protein CME63_02330 [Halobacteriovoraceae bacterium]|nr:hypothetical protein [Halobacteriovoraceae bacterium]|tara:strand:+ start:129858 stop:130370 length:513 start_codon:yes stop_codon:yes gene_type:complete
MLNVEFIFDKDCPNVKASRANLMKAFSNINLNARWKEWDRNSDVAPVYVKKHGSPTILINGVDIMGVEPESDANCCRLYEGSGIPSIELISSKLMEAANSFPSKKSKVFDFLGIVSTGPVLGVAFLAKAACPLCYPAIADILSSVGLGFLFEGYYFNSVVFRNNYFRAWF